MWQRRLGCRRLPTFYSTVAAHQLSYILMLRALMRQFMLLSQILRLTSSKLITACRGAGAHRLHLQLGFISNILDVFPEIRENILQGRCKPNCIKRGGEQDKWFNIGRENIRVSQSMRENHSLCLTDDETPLQRMSKLGSTRQIHLWS